MILRIVFFFQKYPIIFILSEFVVILKRNEVFLEKRNHIFNNILHLFYTQYIWNVIISTGLGGKYIWKAIIKKYLPAH